jgi:hypothetical protein
MRLKNVAWMLSGSMIFVACGDAKDGTTAQNGQNGSITQEQVCDCIADMDAALEEIMGEASGSTTSLKEWMAKVEETAVDCMKGNRSPEENKRFVEMQEKCPGFAKYQGKVDGFRSKLRQLKEESKPDNDVKDMNEIAPGGAQELLDKLKNSRK